MIIMMRKIYYIFDFFVYYLINLVKSNLYLTYDILSPKMRFKPGFIEVPLTLKSDFGMLLFSNLLSMTPGSLTIDISENRQFVLVHVLYRNDPTEMLDDIQKMQGKIKKLTE